VRRGFHFSEAARSCGPYLPRDFDVPDEVAAAMDPVRAPGPCVCLREMAPLKQAEMKRLYLYQNFRKALCQRRHR